ncbi:unnamed protein product, partial [Rotaria sp. Silwood1]
YPQPTTYSYINPYLIYLLPPPIIPLQNKEKLADNEHGRCRLRGRHD